jgi:hypothetical protein
MSGVPDDVVPSLTARITVLEQFVRLMFRSSVRPGEITADQIKEMAEELKTNREAHMRPESAAYMTAAIDNFFNAVAADLRKLSEGP